MSRYRWFILAGAAIILLTVSGRIAWWYAPVPPKVQEYLYRSKLERLLRDALGSGYSLEIETSPFDYDPPGSNTIIPGRAAWSRTETAIARSLAEPDFVVYMDVGFDTRHRDTETVDVGPDWLLHAMEAHARRHA